MLQRDSKCSVFKVEQASVLQELFIFIMTTVGQHCVGFNKLVPVCARKML